jgi:mannose-6-phosphate isomerase-like protein (cupin superfamily)
MRNVSESIESPPAQFETNAPPGFEIVAFDQLPGVLCPCGTSRRAFGDVADYPLTIHRTEISDDARCHYHRHLTECYYILECAADAAMELDGKRVPIRPGLCVLIRPGVRHRALGRMTVLNIVSPKFTADDEWFD